MRKLTTLLAGILLLATSAQAETLEVNPDRMIKIGGPVDASIIAKANRLLDFTKTSKEPVYLVINSPGGSVVAGLQVVTAIRVAKSRGVEVHCVVPMLAASMGFQIFAECTHRYAFENSLFLWHPIRVFIQGPVTPRDARRLAKDMALYEKHLVKVLLDTLQIPSGEFYYHYYNETLHLGVGLNELSPEFMTLIDDIKGIKIPFSMRG